MLSPAIFFVSGLANVQTVGNVFRGLLVAGFRDRFAGVGNNFSLLGVDGKIFRFFWSGMAGSPFKR